MELRRKCIVSTLQHSRAIEAVRQIRLLPDHFSPHFGRGSSGHKENLVCHDFINILIYQAKLGLPY